MIDHKNCYAHRMRKFRREKRRFYHLLVIFISVQVFLKINMQNQFLI